MCPVAEGQTLFVTCFSLHSLRAPKFVLQAEITYTPPDTELRCPVKRTMSYNALTMNALQCLQRSPPNPSHSPPKGRRPAAASRRCFRRHLPDWNGPGAWLGMAWPLSKGTARTSRIRLKPPQPQKTPKNDLEVLRSSVPSEDFSVMANRKQILSRMAGRARPGEASTSFGFRGCKGSKACQLQVLRFFGRLAACR